MYKVLPTPWVFGAIAWAVIGVVLLVSVANEFLHSGLKITTVPGAVWICFNIIFLQPVWRWVWKKLPFLNNFIFPDLNGHWEVYMESNWPRQQQLLSAASGKTGNIDFQQCDAALLAPLTGIALHAEILQTWWKIEIVLHNPQNDTPIDRSDVISADPFRAEGLRSAGLNYFYKQSNKTVALADDNEFYGAARVEYDKNTGQLKGLFWTARMWNRAMNTAGQITFRRVTI